VRSGNIFYVATTGNDSTGTGSFSAPWLTLLKARGAIAAGDTVYAENGVAQNADDGSGFNTCMSLDANSGTAGNSKAMVAYPGATATIGSSAVGICSTGLRSKGNVNYHWVFAELQLRGQSSAMNSYNDQDWRLVGNDVTCPNASVLAQAGCLDPGGDSTGATNNANYRIYGNNIHHAATNNSPGTVTGLYHGFYLSEIHHDVDIGWNTIAFVMGGRCFQQHVNNGPGDYDLHVHDNLIHDCPMDGILMTTDDPSKGTVEVYNNVIYNAGQGPNPVDNGGNWSCISPQGFMESGVTGESGTFLVYSNTMYACGTLSNPNDGNSGSGGISWNNGGVTAKNVTANNNIIYLTTGPTGWNYFAPGNTAGVTGTNNLVFGNGTSTAGCTCSNTVTSDPSFVNASSANFHLSASGSPANGAGTTTAPVPTLDHDGLTRPSPAAIGAFEFSTSSLPNGAPKPVMFLSARMISSRTGD